MKIFLTAICFLFIGHNSQGQNIRWGETIKHKNHLNSYLGSDGESFYLLMYSGNAFHSSYFIEKYNFATLSMIYSNEIDFMDAPEEFGGKNLNYQKVTMLGGSLYLLSFTELKKNRYIFSQGIDLATGELKSDLSIIDTTIAGNETLKIFISRDTKKILIRELGEDKSITKFSAKVFDENMKPLWSSTFTFEKSHSEMGITDCVLLNDGNICLSLYKHEKEKNRKLPNYSYALYFYDYKSNTPTESILNPGESFITEILLTSDAENRVVTGGYYSDDNESLNDHSYKYARMNGFFLSMLDPVTHQAGVMKKIPVPQSLINEIEPSKKNEESNKLTSLYLNKIVLNNDTVLFLGEEAWTSTEQVNFISEADRKAAFLKRQATSYTIYHKFDIVCAEITTDGKLLSAYTIDKGQRYRNNGYLSYFYYKIDGAHNFLFNDSPDNNDKLGEYVMKEPEKSTGRLATINRNGNKTYKSLFNTKDIGMNVYPSYTIAYEEGKLLFFAIDINEIRFGLCTY